jgi:hypothetical protein
MNPWSFAGCNPNFNTPCSVMSTDTFCAPGQGLRTWQDVEDVWSLGAVVQGSGCRGCKS